MTPPHPLERFADEVGPSGPVTVRGGGGGLPAGVAVVASAREVRAPTGVVSFEPAEMVVRVRAGTLMSDLVAALGEARQTVNLAGADRPGATVGGSIAVGRTALRRLTWGHVRDTLLEARYVSADGRLVKAGGPTVKNVSGYDLCRLLVGSFGTLGFLAEVVLRTRPVPEVSQWFTGTAPDAGPLAQRLLADLYRPSAVLADDGTCWVLVEGYQPDVHAQGEVCASLGLTPATQAPPLGSTTLVEVSAGRLPTQIEPRPLAPEVVELHQRIKAVFDPTGRLNPGLVPWARPELAVAP